MGKVEANFEVHSLEWAGTSDVDAGLGVARISQQVFQELGLRSDPPGRDKLISIERVPEQGKKWRIYCLARAGVASKSGVKKLGKYEISLQYEHRLQLGFTSLKTAQTHLTLKLRAQPYALWFLWKHPNPIIRYVFRASALFFVSGLLIGRLL